MSNINIDINSTHQNVEISVGETQQNVEVAVSEFRGRSAYQVWLDAGNTGSLDDYFVSIGTLGPEGSASLAEAFERKGSGILSGSVTNYIPVIVSQSSQIVISDTTGFTSYSSSVHLRTSNLEAFSSSLDAIYATDIILNTFTQSYNVASASFDNRIDKLEDFSSSLNITYATDLELSQTASFLQIQINQKLDTGSFLVVSQSMDSRLDSLESQSGSSQTAFNSYTQSNDLRVQSLEIESASIRSTFNSFTQSVTTEQTIQNGRLSSLETESGSVRIQLNTYTQSTDIRLGSLETESVSVRGYFNTYTSSNDIRLDIIEITTSSINVSLSNLNSFTQSADLRLVNLETESGSIRSIFNSYTSSNDILNTNQTNRLDGLSTESGSIRISFNSFTESVNIEQTSQNNRLASIETASGSAIGRLNNIELFSSSVDNKFSTLATYTSSNDTTNTAQNSRLSSLEITSGSTIGRLNNLETFSGSVNTKFSTLSTYTSSNDTLNTTQNNRLTSLEIESGSIRNVFNSYTSSNDTTNTTQTSRLDQLSTASGSSIGRLNNLELFSGSVNTKFDTLATYTSSNDTLNTTQNSRLDLLSTQSGSAIGRLNNLELFSGSVNTKFSTLATYTGSNDILNTTQNSRLDLISLFTASASTRLSSIETFTSSANLQLSSLEIESGSIRTNFNSYTSSNDSINTTQTNRLDLLSIFSGSANGRLNNIETFSGSVNTKFDTLATYTGSNDTTNTTQNNRLDQLSTASGSAIGRLNNLESFSGSVNTKFTTLATYTGSNDTLNTAQNSRLTSLETTSGSAIGRLNNIELFTSSINTTIKEQLDVNTIISGSSQLTASFDERYLLSGSIANPDWNTISNIPSNIVSSSSQLTSSYDLRYELMGSGILSGSVLNYIPVIVSQSSQIDLTSTTNYTGFSSSITNTFDSQSVRLNGIDSFTSSADGRLDNIELTTSSFELRLDSLETESGSIRNVFNLFTQSINTEQTTQNNRLDLLSTESGSIRLMFNSYTSSNDTTNSNQNNRLDSLSTESGSMRITLNTYTQSNDSRLSNIELFTSSYNTGSFTGSFIGNLIGNSSTSTTASYVQWNSVDNKPLFASQSVFNSYTSSVNPRISSLEVESGSIRSTFNSYTQSINTEQTTQNSRLDGLSTETGSIRLTVNTYTQSANLRLQSLESESGSIRNEFNTYTASNDSINITQNNRLDGLSIESGSIRTTLNTYTQSNDQRVQSLEIESASVKGRLGNIENFSASQLVLNPTFATTGSNIFIGNQTITGSVNQTGSFVVNNLTYPTLDNGEYSFLQTDGLGNLTLQYVETLYETIVNGEATQLVKGTPVYVSGSQGADAIVYRADAADPLKMPVIYIAADTIEPLASGRGILLGLITGVDTTGYGSGTEVYVGSGGGWTASRPTGSATVQTLGIVTKEGNGGQGVVLNPGPNNIPNLTTGHFWIGNGNWLPTPIPTASFTTTSSFNEYTSSANSRLVHLETESGSIRTTFNSYTQSTDLRLDTIEAQTSSYARTDTPNTFTNIQTFTDINVNGTASFAYIQAVTGSSTSIGDAFIVLNENTPASNFAGIKVIDSGSSFTTSSFVYDGLNNNWVFEHSGVPNSGSAMAIFGPLTQGGLGTEIGLTQNRIPKAVTVHGHHIGDSNISDDGIKVEITLPLNVSNSITGSTITATTSFIGSLSGTADTASYVQWNLVDNKPLLVSQSTFDTFQTQSNNRLNNIELTTASIHLSLANIRSFTESIDLRVDSLELESGSVRGRLTNIENFTSSQLSINSLYNTYTASNDTTNSTQTSRLDLLSTFSGSANGRLNNLETFSGSVNTKFSTLATYTGSNDTTNTTQNNRLDLLSTQSGSAIGRLNNIETFTSSIDTTIKTKLNVESVISGSAQIKTLTYYKEAVSGNSTYNVNHNLNELHPIVQVYDTDDEQVIPTRIKSNSVNQVLIEFTSTFSGSVVVKV